MNKSVDDLPDTSTIDFIPDEATSSYGKESIEFLKLSLIECKHLEKNFMYEFLKSKLVSFFHTLEENWKTPENIKMDNLSLRITLHQ